MVPLNMTYLYCLQHSLFEHLFNLYYTAFELTQDSGVVDQYGAKKMLQIFNMNPTTEDVTKRYTEHHKEGEHERRPKKYNRLKDRCLLSWAY